MQLTLLVLTLYAVSAAEQPLRCGGRAFDPASQSCCSCGDPTQYVVTPGLSSCPAYCEFAKGTAQASDVQCPYFKPVHGIPIDVSQYAHFDQGMRVAMAAGRPALLSDIIRKALMKNGSLTITVVGGSETAGMLCSDGQNTGKACSWPARFGGWLAGAYPDRAIDVDNQAIGGTTTSAAIPLLHAWIKQKPSMLMVDFVVNDAFDPQEGTHTLLSAQESFVRGVQRSGIPMVYVITCALEICTEAISVVQHVAAVYGIPVVSYYDVSKSASELAGADLSYTYWDVGPEGSERQPFHPSWKTHQLIADTVAYCWASAEQGCSHRYPPRISRAPADEEPCTDPVSYFSAADGKTHAGVASYNWFVAEDRKDKIGWVSEEGESWISFPLRFVATPRLMITYLRSYEGIGKARMHFADMPNNTVTLDGIVLGGPNVSQYFLHVFPVQRHGFFIGADRSTDILGFGIEAGSEHVLRFDGVGKFKLITVSTC